MGSLVIFLGSPPYWVHSHQCLHNYLDRGKDFVVCHYDFKLRGQAVKMAGNLTAIDCPAPFLNALQFGNGGCRLHISYPVEPTSHTCLLTIAQTPKADYARLRAR